MYLWEFVIVSTFKATQSHHKWYYLISYISSPVSRRRGGLMGVQPPPPIEHTSIFHKFQVIIITVIEENQENTLLQLNMQFPSSWNDCRRQFNCRHHAVSNDISTQSTKLNKFAISIGRPGPKKAPASGGFAPRPPDQGLCPWTPLGALPDTRYMLVLRACHVTSKPNSCIHQCNPLHCEILCLLVFGSNDLSRLSALHHYLLSRGLSDGG